MKRIKIFLVTVVSVLLLVLFSNNTFAKIEYRKVKLSSSGTLNTDSTADMYKMSNVFCVAHNQDCGKATYSIVGSAHISGGSVTLKKWKGASYNSGNGTPVAQKTISSGTVATNSNKLAAIFHTSGLKGGGSTNSYDKDEDKSIAFPIPGEQLTLWWYWNTWAGSLPADGLGTGAIDWKTGVFELGADNKDLTNTQKENAQYNMNLVTQTAANGYYDANIYYLECSTYDDWQNLILVDIPDTTSVPVEKKWKDDSNRDGIRPKSVTVRLWADGVKTDKTLTLSANTDTSKNWKGRFSGLQKYKNGNLINYTVTEDVPSGYELTSTEGNATDGYTLINYHEPERVKLSIEKKWEDQDNLDEYRPTSITVKVKRTITKKDGKKETQWWNPDVDGYWVSKVKNGKAIELKEENKWKHTPSAKFYKYYEGTEIDYTFDEINVPEQYKSEVKEVGTRKEVKDEDGNLEYTIIYYEMKNTHTPKYSSYLKITGKVWLDNPSGKANDVNGILDKDDPGLEGIKVVLKDAEGNQFDATSTATTNKNGNYTIKVNYDNRENVYKQYAEESKVREKLKTAYVEFEYDGMKYTTVKVDSKDKEGNYISSDIRSKAKENENTRTNIDKEYSTVPNKSTIGTTITASTKNVIKSFDTYTTENNKENYDDTKTDTVTVKYCNGNGTYSRTNPEGAWKDIITAELPENHPDHTGNCTDQNHGKMREFEVEVDVIKNVNLGLFEREKPDVAIFSELEKVDVSMNGYNYTYEYDSLENNIYDDKDNVKAQFQSDGKDVYVYRRPVNPADIAEINAQNKDLMEVYVTYVVKVANMSTTLPITVNSVINAYDSDYEVKEIVKGSNQVKYTVSNVYGAKDFNEITLTDLGITVQPQTEPGEDNLLYIKYKVNPEQIKQLFEKEASLHNSVEIASYSTLYGKTTLYAEQRTGGRTNQPYAGIDNDSTPGNAAIERSTATYTYTDDSTGNVTTYNNVEILKAKVPEDDTCIAPSFILHKDEEKTFSGNVWVDSDTGKEKGSNNFRVGDGKKSEKERNLANVKVELLNADENGNSIINSETGKPEIANLRHSENGSTKPAVTYTDKDGNYRFGDENYGIVTDRYIIKFTYGEGIQYEEKTISSAIQGVNVNARDYKSTIISEDNKILYDYYKDNNNANYEWHLNTSKGYSIAVDNMEERVKISDLQYSTFGDLINITAMSKPFDMQIEYDPNTAKTSSVKADGKTLTGGTEKLENDLNIFDFGIIERAREDIYTEKTIENVKITLGSGIELINGNPNNTDNSLKYTRANGFGKTIANSKNAREAMQKRLMLEVDTELLQEAQIHIKYAIKVVNHSEKDYDYYLGNESEAFDESQLRKEFYYFGTNNEGAPEITSSINSLVDYVDSNLECKWENANDWTEISADNLREEGKELISPETYEAIKTGKYKAYTTSKYSNLEPGKTSDLEYAYAVASLSNSDEDNYQNVFENHVEILQIDSKTARTIKDSEKNGVPTKKLYKTGNYVPSTEKRTENANLNNAKAGLHEQDDDGVIVTVTPPTGLMDNIVTYAVITLVSLIVIVLGVTIIKKKVLTK